MKGDVSTVSSFDAVPQVFFFGEQNRATGTFGIRIVQQNGEIYSDMAHSAQITSFEYSVINNAGILFSGSRDRRVKAWSMQQGSLKCDVDKLMPAEVLCMQLTSPTYLVAGLSDGTLAGWDLLSDQISILPAHISPITSIMLHDQFLVSGDASGILKMFDTTNNFRVVLEGKTNF